MSKFSDWCSRHYPNDKWNSGFDAGVIFGGVVIAIAGVINRVLTAIGDKSNNSDDSESEE